MQDAEVAAVLCALAGPRRGDPVAAFGVPAVVERALLSAAGTSATVAAAARVAVAGTDAGDLRRAVEALVDGGRVACLADQRLGAALGLTLRHVEPLGDAVAWSAVVLRP